MDIQLAQWGNSLGMRIPSVLSKELGLKKGSRVRVEIKRGKLVVSPMSDEKFERFKAMGKQFNLREMLKHITEENRPRWPDYEPAGKEIW